VHVLARKQRELAELFGGTTGDDVDKFTRCAWHDGADHVPVLDDAIAWFTGPVIDRHPVGDHVGFVIEIDDAGVRNRNEQLLTFSDVKDVDPGHDA
jgi:flavin reductase (DIM6/NTAB) family NADH-FMN oxidoreductase RutF